MRVRILALGSRGDVQPFIALVLRLREAGHDAAVIATDDYASLASRYGAPFRSAGGSIADLMDRRIALAALDGSANPIALARRFVDGVAPHLPPIYSACWTAVRDADLIVASTLGLLIAPEFAEKLDVPLVGAHFHPVARTADVGPVHLPGWTGRLLSPRLASAAGALPQMVLAQLLHEALNEARRRTDAGPIRSRRDEARLAGRPPALSLYGYSRQLLPPVTGLPPEIAVTGFWMLPAPPGWRPDPVMERFVGDGRSVYVGFGSLLGGRDPEALTQLIGRAGAAAGRRIVLFRGWGDLGSGRLPAHLLAVDETPHVWLFPRMAAAVHHAGAGTTGAALRAGIPSIPVPAYGDMNLWARRIARLGAATEPIPRSELTTDRLAAALLAATGLSRLRDGAARLGRRLAAEDGTGNAVRAIERTS
ncbi:MAG: glycosyltransferase [Dehalococcoidia bacterium]